MCGLEELSERLLMRSLGRSSVLEIGLRRKHVQINLWFIKLFYVFLFFFVILVCKDMIKVYYYYYIIYIYIEKFVET